jgi:TrmH family RNA methyltransferase
MPDPITSRDNPKLKAATRVREGKERGLIFIEGLRLSEDALRSSLEIKEAFHTSEFGLSARGSAMTDELRQITNHVYQVSDKAFAQLPDTKNSQGIILIATRPASGRQAIEEALKTTSAPVVVLHKINNPSNLGAILRSAEGAGTAGIILTNESTDPFSAKALRGSMGSCFRVPVWEDVDLKEVANWAANQGIGSVATDARAENSYLGVDWREPKLLVMGSEAHGFSPEELAMIDETITIPMNPGAESLNVAVACAVILFEARRQRS